MDFIILVLILDLWEMVIYPRYKKPSLKSTYYERLGGASGLQVATSITALVAQSPLLFS